MATNPHTANTILTKAILIADKHHIPKGKIKPNHTPLPETITSKINERNNIRKANPKDPTLPTLNQTINNLINEHGYGFW